MSLNKDIVLSISQCSGGTTSGNQLAAHGLTVLGQLPLSAAALDELLFKKLLSVFVAAVDTTMSTLGSPCPRLLSVQAARREQSSQLWEPSGELCGWSPLPRSEKNQQLRRQSQTQ